MIKLGKNLKSRGFGIVVEHGKTVENIGGILRSADCFGAAFVAIVAGRYKRQITDTMAAYKRLPLFFFEDWAEYQKCCPFDWIPVAVEVHAKANLENFIHPKSAVYFIGPENGSLTAKALEISKHQVKIDSGCLNQCVAASVVMYARNAFFRP